MTQLTLATHAVVLRRDERSWQVGIDPDHALVLTGAGFGALLRELDRCPTLPDIRLAGRRAGLDAGAVHGAMDALLSRGLVVERPRPLRPPQTLPALPPAVATAGPGSGLGRRSIRLVGAGPIARRAAEILLAAGVGTLFVYDDNPPERQTYPYAGVLATRAEALRSALSRTGGGLVEPISHWTQPDGRTVDLTVLVADGPEVDRVLTDHLLRSDAPHLLVRILGPAATVGPLVLPGRTSCLHCADLTRRDADPCWPSLLDQLGRVRLDPDLPVAAWAAATVAAQALAHLHGEASEVAGATLELAAPGYATQRRLWPAHRDCGCSWSGPTEWAHD